jgi:16S rRNA (cytidine1402-2'-O)-methyltransferase
MEPSGTLYVVATPIGNLKDITIRAVEILKEVHLIAAEDTRRTKNLLQLYEIKTKLISYHDYNKEQRGKKILEYLLAGKTVALVSDAGTPGISDPGYYLINLAIRNDIRVVPVPGVSAIIAALSVSGLPSDRFCFEGFLPRKINSLRQTIEILRDEDRTVIFYESPYRIINTLKEFLEIAGERWVVVARELTKFYEEIIRGPLSEVLAKLRAKKSKGEFTVLISSQKYTEKVLSLKKE